MTRIALRFWNKHIDPVRQKDKRLTARYNFERNIRQGYTIQFIDKDNLKFGRAYVLQHYNMPISNFAETDWKYHRNYESVGELLDMLEKYYPDVPRGDFDELTVIEWGRTFSSNPHYTG